MSSCCDGKRFRKKKKSPSQWGQKINVFQRDNMELQQGHEQHNKHHAAESDRVDHQVSLENKVIERQVLAHAAQTMMHAKKSRAEKQVQSMRPKRAAQTSRCMWGPRIEAHTSGVTPQNKTWPMLTKARNLCALRA